MKSIGPAKCVWMDLRRYVEYIDKLDRKNHKAAGEACYGARQPEVYAAQERKNEITIMREVPCRKGDVGSHTL